MKNAKVSIIFKKFLCLVMAGLLGTFLFASVNVGTAKAEETVVYYDDYIYNSSGSHVNDSYQIAYDELDYLIEGHESAPSLGIHDNSINNACATLAGANIITFYDRYFPDLVPNFEPGGINPLGFYSYYPDLAVTPTIDLVANLHNLMNSADGTTEAEFKSGMQSFLSSKGRSISYQSFYSTSTNVNLSLLDSALNQNKVALLMCSTYNFVSSVAFNTNNNVYYVSKTNSNAGHMMMVYGYEIYNVYVGGQLVRSDTFLAVSSSYSDGDTGFILLNDDLTIQKAYIVTIT